MIRSLARDRVEFGRVSGLGRRFWMGLGASMALLIAGLTWSEFLVLMAFFGVVVAVPLGCLCGLLGLSDRRPPERQRLWCAVFLVCWCYVPAVFAGATANRRRQEWTVTVRMRPLIDALDAFERDHGRPAEALERLVPDYLHEVPLAPGGLYASLEYQSDDVAWRLSVRGIGFDLLSAGYDPPSRSWWFVWD